MIQDYQHIPCPIQRAATLVADVPTIVILRELRQGPRRFNDFVNVGLNPRTLTDRLQRLAQEHIVERTRYAEVPPRVEYRLTPKGQALFPVLDALKAFADVWIPYVPDNTPTSEASPRETFERSQ